jgi:hypothetical protein
MLNSEQGCCIGIFKRCKSSRKIAEIQKISRGKFRKLYRKETLESKGILMLQNFLVEPVRLLLNMLLWTFSYTKTSTKVSTDCTDKFKG